MARVKQTERKIIAAERREAERRLPAGAESAAAVAREELIGMRVRPRPRPRPCTPPRSPLERAATDALATLAAPMKRHPRHSAFFTFKPTPVRFVDVVASAVPLPVPPPLPVLPPQQEPQQEQQDEEEELIRWDGGTPPIETPQPATPPLFAVSKMGTCLVDAFTPLAVVGSDDDDVEDTYEYSYQVNCTKPHCGYYILATDILSAELSALDHSKVHDIGSLTKSALKR